jgi:hypothetical protein
MTYTATLFNPSQAHVVIKDLWPRIKSQLMAGHRLELSIKGEKRSIPQNKRYWGNGVLAQIAKQATTNGKLYDAEVWHEYFKRMFIGVIELPDGSVQGMSSTGLDKADFSEFCSQVEAYAASELGVVFEDLPKE